MSMGLVLLAARDRLRTRLSLSADRCGIRPGGEPPATAGATYVSVDERGVSASGFECLSEKYEIEVSLWRRAAAVPDDRAGRQLAAVDPYWTGAASLDRLERQAIAALHADFDLMAAANAALAELAPGEPGFHLALCYTGRGRTEVVAPKPSRGGRQPTAAEWLVRKLNFVGMHRAHA